MYTEKPEIPVGKPNGSCNSVWEASKNVVYSLRQCNFFLVCSADSGSFSHEVYFMCARDFHPGGLLSGKHLGNCVTKGKMNVFVA